MWICYAVTADGDDIHISFHLKERQKKIYKSVWYFVKKVTKPTD